MVALASPSDEPEPHGRRHRRCDWNERDLERYAETTYHLVKDGHLPLLMASQIATALVEGGAVLVEEPSPSGVVLAAPAAAPATESRTCRLCHFPKPYPEGFRSHFNPYRFNRTVCTACGAGEAPPDVAPPPPPAPGSERRCSWCLKIKPYPSGFRSAYRPQNPNLVNKRKCTECGLNGGARAPAQEDEEQGVPDEPLALAPMCVCGCSGWHHHGGGCTRCLGCTAFRAKGPCGCPAQSADPHKPCGWPLATGSDVCAAHTRRRALGLPVVLLDRPTRRSPP